MGRWKKKKNETYNWDLVGPVNKKGDPGIESPFSLYRDTYLITTIRLKYNFGINLMQLIEYQILNLIFQYLF